MNDNLSRADLNTSWRNGNAEPGSNCPVPLAGKVLGAVPYDFTLPTPDKIRSRLWNPHSDKLFGPHMFGIGWTPNFGAMAVRLGVIEPDAEDDPMNTFPGEAWAAVVALPAALAGVSVLTDKDLPKAAKLIAAGSAFAVTGAVLAGLAVAGRRVEQRRDGLA